MAMPGPIGQLRKTALLEPISAAARRSSPETVIVEPGGVGTRDGLTLNPGVLSPLGGPDLRPLPLVGMEFPCLVSRVC